MKSTVMVAAILTMATCSNGAVWILYGKTATIGGYDEYTISVAAFEGPDAATAGPETVPSISAINLHLTAGSNVVFSVPGKTATWKSLLTNAGLGGQTNSPPASYVNFDTLDSATRNGGSILTSTSTDITIQAEDLAGSQFRISAYDPNASTIVNSGFYSWLLAKVYVTAGSPPAFDSTSGIPTTPGPNQWSIVGTTVTTYAGPTSDLINGGVSFVFPPIPEPSSFAGLGLCAFGIATRRQRIQK